METATIKDPEDEARRQRRKAAFSNPSAVVWLA
jgi:hypothetical protein